MPNIGEIKKGRELGYKGEHRCVWQACSICSKERWIILRREGVPSSRMCGQCRTDKLIERNKANVGQRCQNWRGGKIIDTHNYALVRIYPNDFFFPMAQKNWYIREHRLIMAKQLGRCLMDFEEVHHKNGIKNDNRLENLRLVIHTDHTGEVKCPFCLNSFEIK